MLVVPLDSGEFQPPDDGLVPPLRVFQKCTKNGIIALWVVFALMCLGVIYAFATAVRLPKGQRVYHYVTGLVLVIGVVNYYSLAAQDGVKFIYIGHHTFRQIYFARFIDWLMATPLISLDLALLAGLPLFDLIVLIVANIGMVLLATVASFSRTDFKWGYYGFSCFFYLCALYTILVPGRAAASRKSDAVGKFFTSIGVYILVVLAGYFVVGAFSEGLYMISVDMDIYLFGVLDVLSKIVFGIWLLSVDIPEARIKLGSFWTGSLGGDYDPLDIDD